MALFGRGVAAVGVGNEGSRVKGGEHELVGDDLGFASRMLTGGADDIGGEGNGFLPDFEIANVGSHGPKMAARKQKTGTERLHTVLKRRDLPFVGSL
jgi:hypothetical protein